MTTDTTRDLDDAVYSMAQKIARQIYESALAGARGTGLYTDGAAAATFNGIMLDVVERHGTEWLRERLGDSGFEVVRREDVETDNQRLRDEVAALRERADILRREAFAHLVAFDGVMEQADKDKHEWLDDAFADSIIDLQHAVDYYDALEPTKAGAP